MAEYRYGDIPRNAVGKAFPTRKLLSEAGIHRPTQPGISGSSTSPAESIVVSGGYEDDEDHGDLINLHGTRREGP